MYKEVIILDLSDLSGKLRDLCEEYADENFSFFDALVPFYFKDYLTSFIDKTEKQQLEYAIMHEVYALYPELLGRDFSLNIWWD